MSWPPQLRPPQKTVLSPKTRADISELRQGYESFVRKAEVASQLAFEELHPELCGGRSQYAGPKSQAALQHSRKHQDTASLRKYLAGDALDTLYRDIRSKNESQAIKDEVKSLRENFERYTREYEKRNKQLPDVMYQLITDARLVLGARPDGWKFNFEPYKMETPAEPLGSGIRQVADDFFRQMSYGDCTESMFAANPGLNPAPVTSDFFSDTITPQVQESNEQFRAVIRKPLDELHDKRLILEQELQGKMNSRALQNLKAQLMADQSGRSQAWSRLTHKQRKLWEQLINLEQGEIPRMKQWVHGELLLFDSSRGIQASGGPGTELPGGTVDKRRIQKIEQILWKYRITLEQYESSQAYYSNQMEPEDSATVSQLYFSGMR